MSFTRFSTNSVPGLHPASSSALPPPLFRCLSQTTVSAASSSRVRCSATPSRPAASRPGNSLSAPKEESDILWAGYSDLTDHLTRVEQRNEKLARKVDELTASLKMVEQQQNQMGANLPAASFLLVFMMFINTVGLIARFNVNAFVPAVARDTFLHQFFKNCVPVLVPICNTAVVLLVCFVAAKTAWRVLTS